MSAAITRSEQRDLAGLCRMMIILRVICVGATLSVLAFLTGAGFDIHAAFPVAGLLPVVFPLSAIWWLMLKSGYSFRALIYSQLIADLLIEGGVVYFTGGAQSHFTVLFMVTIFLAGIFVCLKGAVLVATLSAGLFTGSCLLARANPRPFSAASEADSAITYVILNITLQVAFFYLIALLSGYVARRTRAFGARLKSTTSELHKARMDTHHIIESMNSGFVSVDQNHVITEFNQSASRILGIPADQARSRHVSEIIGPISQDLSRKLEIAVNQGREEERGEVLAETPSGRTIPLGTSMSLLSGDNGESAGVVLVFQDLTEVKDMAERMRLSDRLVALGELSAGIAHEIRTPLASICGSIEMLRDSLKPTGEDMRLLDLVIKESERLRKKIDHFLEFAKSRPARFRMMPLGSVLSEVICLVRNHPHFKDGVSVELEMSPGLEAWVDEETIKQVFYNLAINAIEAMDSSGCLRISLDGPIPDGCGSCAIVTFEDNGTGIAERDLKRVYDPFFTKKKSGTGLGLAIASKIVEEHGGRLQIDSTEGAGTVVRVYLPLDRSEFVADALGAGSSQGLVEMVTDRAE
jgi:two-component system sensor histidine kinase PilS (NtrC family)